jgi:hypothetical protein
MNVNLVHYWKTAGHATASFAALVIVLLTIYAQNQSSRYNTSFIGFRRALHYEEASEVTNFANVWKWFDGMTNSIASDTLGEINANCGYNSPNYQDVNIHGTHYNLLDPSVQDGACSNYRFITDPTSAVYLSDTGNHELKLFGVFTGRSVSEPSRDRSKVVQKNTLSKWDALTDSRVLETCEAPMGGLRCVLKDGYASSMVSTLGWDGEIINNIHAFSPSSRARLVTPGKPDDDTQAEITLYSSCFNNVSGELVSINTNYTIDKNNPLKDYKNCDKTWVTHGYDIRKSCLDASVTQEPAKYAFMISTLNYSTLTEMRNDVYACDLILALNERQLSKVFFIEDDFLTTSI